LGGGVVGDGGLIVAVIDYSGAVSIAMLVLGTATTVEGEEGGGERGG
jgi:hypothetical protein